MGRIPHNVALAALERMDLSDATESILLVAVNVSTGNERVIKAGICLGGAYHYIKGGVPEWGGDNSSVQAWRWDKEDKDHEVLGIIINTKQREKFIDQGHNSVPDIMERLAPCLTVSKGILPAGLDKYYRVVPGDRIIILIDDDLSGWQVNTLYQTLRLHQEYAPNTCYSLKMFQFIAEVMEKDPEVGRWLYCVNFATGGHSPHRLPGPPAVSSVLLQELDDPYPKEARNNMFRAASRIKTGWSNRDHPCFGMVLNAEGNHRESNQTYEAGVRKTANDTNNIMRRLMRGEDVTVEELREVYDAEKTLCEPIIDAFRNRMAKKGVQLRAAG